MTDPRRSEISAAETSSPPNGLYVLPNGEVAYIFEGEIIALGLILKEYKTGEENRSRIRWLDESDATREYLYGWYETLGEKHRLEIGVIGVNAKPTIKLIAGPGAASDSQIMLVAGNVERLLLGKEGLSSFIQAPKGTGTEKRERNRGKSTILKTGAQTANLVISHGLGATPFAVDGTAQSRDINVATFNYTETQFTAEIRDITGANITSDQVITWQAET